MALRPRALNHTRRSEDAVWGLVSRYLRAYPTLLRVGLASLFAYRAEFLIWILTTNMPLVMMGLWTAVAADGPVGGFDQTDFVAYFLAVLIIRIVTNNWLVWELTMEIRHGTLMTRLLRPVHPIVALSAEHIAAIPMRVIMISPAIVLLFWVAWPQLSGIGLGRALMLPVALAGAWTLLFCTMLLIGTLALFVESALSLFELWLGIHFVLSGYLFPLSLLPGWLQRFSTYLPFRYTLAFPVELMLGRLDPGQATAQLGIQWAFVAGTAGAAALVWRAGMRRFAAFGG